MAKVNTISEREIKAVPVIEPTETWNPIHHSQVIRSLTGACEKEGIEIAAKRYEASADGLDLFATWRLPVSELSVTGHVDSMIIGWRNSMKKRFALGFAAGNNVMVCSNMCLWGDFVEHRRHTPGNMEEGVIDNFIEKALKTIVSTQESHRLWFQELAGIDIAGIAKKAIIFDLLDTGIVSPSQFKKLTQAYDEELKVQRQGAKENYAHLHGAVTRTLREMSISNIQDRTRKLNRLISDKIDVYPEDFLE